MNVVLVKKSNGKWQLCINTMGLTKCVSEILIPLHKIDHLVVATSDHEQLIFRMSSLGIIRISMAELN